MELIDIKKIIVHEDPGEDAIKNPPLRGATTDPGQMGVLGINHGRGVGFLGGRDLVFGQNVGVYGQSDEKGQGVFGHATHNEGTGVFGNSVGGGFGVRGETVGGIAVQGQSFGIGLAGQFIGNVRVTGILTAERDILLAGADCAEEFDVDGDAEIDPGTVMVLGENGTVRPSAEPYDKRVIGIVAGAGVYRPALILDKKATDGKRVALSLIGKVCCKADARHTPIAAGDLLTTSVLPGHSMKAEDPIRAFGAIIGKALAPLKGGLGWVPVLVSLR